jgi:hypothetical protein
VSLERYRNFANVKQEAVLHALCLQYPEIKRLRWRQAVLETMQALAEPEEDEPGEFMEFVMGLNLVPDGYAIHLDERELLFFEVEVHSPMSGKKLQSYGKFAIDLAGLGIGFGVLSVNKHGHINEVDLMPHYASWLAEVSA